MKKIIYMVLWMVLLPFFSCTSQEKNKPLEEDGALEPAKMKEKEVKVQTGTFTLPGTLVIPESDTPVPAIILVHGSGPNDRDETILSNKPFKDLAQGLAKEGIATLRYDKRTKVYGAASASAGEELNLDNEVTQDVLSAIRLLEKEPGIDTRRIYVLGHSLGGMMAPRIASSAPQLAGIILLSAPARRMEDLLLEQVEYLLSLQPFVMGAEKQKEDLKKQVENVKKMGTPAFDKSVPLPLNVPASYWKDLNGYNQVATAASLSMPILVMQGGRDYQVTMEDFEIWKKALAGKTAVTFRSYPDLNHLYLEGTGKSRPEEYTQASHVPAYITKDIAHWINNQVKCPKKSLR